MVVVWLGSAITFASSRELGNVWKQSKDSSLRLEGVGIPVASCKVSFMRRQTVQLHSVLCLEGHRTWFNLCCHRLKTFNF